MKAAMKRMKVLASAAMLLLLASCSGTGNRQESIQPTASGNNTELGANPAELSGIRKALDLYVEASVKGDSAVALPAFAKTATMSYAENGKLVSVPIKALFDYYNRTGAQPASYEITACHVSADVAVVCIDSKFGESRFDDMFTLVKDGTDWKIVSKVYHEKSNAD